MKVKSIHLEQFKRFTDLTISDIPESAKLVVLIGPNGCGKTSIFDAFKTWHYVKAYGNVADNDYCRKDPEERRSSYELVQINFHKGISAFQRKDFWNLFYFRTAYRNSPQVNVSSLSRLSSPLVYKNMDMMIQNDSTVDENYQRLLAKTVSNIYDEKYDDMRVRELRDEILNKIREPLNRLFPDLLLTEIGNVTEGANFYFRKGSVLRYSYEKLSGGEKAAFDLLLDIVVKSEYYENTVFCIDEPETHIHTKLQAALLSELYKLIGDESQLWIATHSFGMLKEAKRLLELHPGEVVFLNFDGYDFDETVHIEPSGCNAAIWNKMIEISLDDYAPYLCPETIVFCEGTSQGRKRKDFDARCYEQIFRNKYPNTMFFSLGGCNDIEERKGIIDFISKMSPNAQIIRLIDRDDRSAEEIAELKSEGIRVLNQRHIECYLLDDEVLKKWCKAVDQLDKEGDLIAIKRQKMLESERRGNPSDDVKSASNDICTSAKKLLGIRQCGNCGEMIMRDTIAKLITEDMTVYKDLEQEIFG